MNRKHLHDFSKSLVKLYMTVGTPSFRGSGVSYENLVMSSINFEYETKSTDLNQMSPLVVSTRHYVNIYSQSSF